MKSLLGLPWERKNDLYSLMGNLSSRVCWRNPATGPCQLFWNTRCYPLICDCYETATKVPQSTWWRKISRFRVPDVVVCLLFWSCLGHAWLGAQWIIRHVNGNFLGPDQIKQKEKITIRAISSWSACQIQCCLDPAHQLCPTGRRHWPIEGFVRPIWIFAVV